MDYDDINKIASMMDDTTGDLPPIFTKSGPRVESPVISDTTPYDLGLIVDKYNGKKPTLFETRMGKTRPAPRKCTTPPTATPQSHGIVKRKLDI